MTAFAPGQPVIMPVPTVTVDGGLPVGDHVFQLLVIDDQGTQSQPTRVVVKIVPPVLTGPGGPGTVGTPVVPPTPVLQPTPVVAPPPGVTPVVQPTPVVAPRPSVTPVPIEPPPPPPGTLS